MAAHSPERDALLQDDHEEASVLARVVEGPSGHQPNFSRPHSVPVLGFFVGQFYSAPI